MPLAKQRGRSRKSSQTIRRYAAKLLFQFRVVVAGESSRLRLCEERIIIIRASNAHKALTQAGRAGRAARFSYLNSDRNRVYFEFIGVLELLHLGVEAGKNEVWYELRDRLLPMERKSKLIPPVTSLNAIMNRE